ncbi:hypothetical protein [Pararhizobium sp.]|uniref:hypothetical protein n=1 Tax=Pararhizobium sp. TaxID=1977563 RepID=UPI00271AA37C|nr:hypothetical protein [Pararhizobium sp.]MDO9417560.1 hypothetical protein [Pararhizobium sp.]
MSRIGVLGLVIFALPTVPPAIWWTVKQIAATKISDTVHAVENSFSNVKEDDATFHNASVGRENTTPLETFESVTIPTNDGVERTAQQLGSSTPERRVSPHIRLAPKTAVSKGTIDTQPDEEYAEDDNADVIYGSQSDTRQLPEREYGVTMGYTDDWPIVVRRQEPDWPIQRLDRVRKHSGKGVVGRGDYYQGVDPHRGQ